MPFKIPVMPAPLPAPKKRISIRSAKAKGRAFEKVVAEAIATTLSIDVGHVTRVGAGASGTDIKLSPVARAIFPYSVECKNHRSLKLPEWIRQAEANAEPGTVPIVVFKQHGDGTPYVVLPFIRFLYLHARGPSNE